ncbi:MAG: DNA repair protein RadA [Prolixibacteraceae bacterium]|jgi:DNA repair protein RadA/Sms|nr:DNA repair protein RadA [Prolixibacteraceae bacterium]MBT6766746.1 DNA repair protein RadA [Prolixibacteraceae bacterium]MBT6998870.1 DNA repair protein RadA [Prolixibacteraceae bacterium]MBT7397345.1 DNA repair protein RadA [Prolixibacteraceae bacterium]
MAQTKSIYTCQNCGAQSPKWLGKCLSCGEWNTLVEEIIEKKKNQGKLSVQLSKNQALTLENIKAVKTQRISVGINEINRVLGGGIVPGSLILLGGEPGIGKSTLVLQLALQLKEEKILYTSGEESLQQIKLRAERLKISNNNCLFLNETSLEHLIAHTEQIKPDLLIIDSIQTLSTETIESSPGSVSQVRECTSVLLKFAKKNNVAIILIGHINKEGSIAGPKVLEHIVDTVLQFEGDTNFLYRLLRANKNRFGSTNELGIFEMRSDGLREITNPSEQLISKINDDISGTAIASTVEGARSFLIEIQALVSSAAYGTPQRSSTGFDLRRLNMLLAVLEKRAGFKLIAKDVFLNIAGGIKINDPAIDLAVICSILSSNIDIAIDHKTCFAAEVGLTGEIRAVSRIEQRIAEAAKLGFKKIYVPKLNKGYTASDFKIDIVKVGRVDEVFRTLFSK